MPVSTGCWQVIGAMVPKGVGCIYHRGKSKVGDV